jgi:hypothetical protein
MRGGIGENISSLPPNEILFNALMVAAETCNFPSWNDL